MCICTLDFNFHLLFYPCLRLVKFELGFVPRTEIIDANVIFAEIKSPCWVPCDMRAETARPDGADADISRLLLQLYEKRTGQL